VQDVRNELSALYLNARELRMTPTCNHLETAVRLQRESWDNSLAVEDILGNGDRDIYALVAELAGGLKDDEAITEDIIDTLISPIPGFESRAGFAAFGRGGKDV
jgi:hypothetical protein